MGNMKIGNRAIKHWANDAIAKFQEDINHSSFTIHHLLFTIHISHLTSHKSAIFKLVFDQKYFT